MVDYDEQCVEGKSLSFHLPFLDNQLSNLYGSGQTIEHDETQLFHMHVHDNDLFLFTLCAPLQVSQSSEGRGRPWGVPARLQIPKT